MKIYAIVIDYTPRGRGKRIFIIRDNGLVRDYPYSVKNVTNLLLVTDGWDTAYFPRSIHIVRS